MHEPLPPLQAAGCMISEAGLLVHGGRGADGDLLSDICIFDGRAGRWVLAQDTGMPRCAHTACNAAVQQHAAQQPAASGGPADSSGSSRGGGGGAAPAAANVLLFGGFDGEGVADDLLQLTFRREQRGAGGHGRVAGVRDAEAALLCDAGAACPALQRHCKHSLAHHHPTDQRTLSLQANAACGRSCGLSRRLLRAPRSHALPMQRLCCPARMGRQLRWWFWRESTRNWT